MKEYTTDKIRNVAVVGHQGCGKTSLVEALLYNTGAITRMGKVEDKNTVSDWDEEERSRGMSINTSLVPIEFNDHKINLLDTPGFTDFQGEVKNAMRVADAVVVVVDAVSGVEVGTELVWDYAREYQQPMIAVINKVDRENANYENVLEQLREAFPKYKFIPVMIPIGQQADFKGVANLVTEKAYFDVGEERSDLPDDMVDVVEEGRMEIIEAAAEADDDLMQKYFDEETLNNDDIRDGMRKASRSHLLRTVPVFVTSGTANIGTYPLMEALIAYTSAPSVRRVRIEREGAAETEYITAPQSDDKALAAYVFKTTTDRFGTLNYFRIFSGVISANSRNINAETGEEERFGTLVVVRGKEQLEVPKLHAGDIGAAAKLNNTKTGDTFADKDADFKIVKPDFPAPLYMVAVTPRTQADSAKMGQILTVLSNNDPTVRWRQDSDTRQTVLEGMGEIHVQTILNKAEVLGVGIDTEVPKVPYKETVTIEAEGEYTHRKQSGGAGQYGRVNLRVMPTEEKFVYETKIFGGSISSSFLPSIEKGIRQVLEEGVIAGYPVVQVKVVVFDGKEHPVDSKDIAFQIAGRESFKIAFRDAKPVLLEPIVNVKITVPDSMMGDIMGDMTTRRGRVQGMDTVGQKSVINAQVPLSEMLRYGNVLRSMSGGRGVYTMEFSHYENMPSHIQEEIVAQMKVDEE
ncbi:MAG: elongation factor G [Anaerolineae bacterium]|nr:elongation factor G [Anaerolineae bacterium]